MGYRLKISLGRTLETHELHRFRIFGTDVWREFNGENEISLKEIDVCIEYFTLSKVKAKMLKRSLRKIEDIAKLHHYDQDLKIETSKDGAPT